MLQINYRHFSCVKKKDFSVSVIFLWILQCYSDYLLLYRSSVLSKGKIEVQRDVQSLET